MPIDITLIRCPDEGGIPLEVLDWQLARISTKYNDLNMKDDNMLLDRGSRMKEYILNLQRMEKEKRSLLKQQASIRTRINQWKKLHGPRRDAHVEQESFMDPNTIKMEIGKLKEILLSVDKEYENMASEIDDKLRYLGNMVVDDTEFCPSSNLGNVFQDRRINIRDDFNLSYSDPLFCIGGCETITIPSYANVENVKLRESNENANYYGSQLLAGKHVLTGRGSDISAALLWYGKQYSTRCHLFDTIQTVHLPTKIMLPTFVAHGAFGCTDWPFSNDHDPNGKRCRICNNQDMEIPSYLALALMNQNTIFSDRKLPCAFLTQDICVQSSEETSDDFAHDIASLNMIAFAVNNLHMSLQLQNSMVEFIVDFYQTLLVDKISVGSSISLVSVSPSREPPIRVRVLDPCALRNHECRRVVVEGHLPSKKRYVELAHVSNHTDYVSRQFNIKCSGGNAQSTNFVYMLESTVVKESAIKWLLENNLSQYQTEAGNSTKIHNVMSGVVVPSVIAQLVSKPDRLLKEGSILWLPFVRDLSKGKGGKIKVIPINSIPDEMYIEMDSHGCDANRKFDVYDFRLLRELQSTDGRSTSDPNPGDEAICNPYDFLPIFQK